MNGTQVGYAEDSFTADTFDVTDYIRYGEENTLAVKVYRWCDGSWLEDQDYFDLSGIFATCTFMQRRRRSCAITAL